ncbi:hypothetical protein Xen7305DRAFT_00012040 [Xenococcus sp. PCC 7305]|uniref:DUF4214 domain-containing protein n=1 Tax=Xenococcus sp. PCC 7305 TaxID=102125 RepID=UPI0002AC96D3|nr:DUF4214 domain-containing protein [Xenococcus sp. PCC 7305]ELS01500.1 hypothetical protein Xen7305DRAFT_00012040 [Xenococcus sp. PCC 7305]
MFKEIAREHLNAEEIKNRLLAYASFSAAEEQVDDNYWYGNISTYTLNLRLSGIYGEIQFADVLSSNVDRTLNIGKYVYLEDEVFVRDTQHLDHANFVKQLYQAFLRRKADEGGLKGNIKQLNNGAHRENLVKGIRASGEADGVFLRVTDCLDDETFIKIAHRVYLNPENRAARRQQDLAALRNERYRSEVFTKLKQFQQLQTALHHLEGDFYQEDKAFLAKQKHLSDEDYIKTLYLTFLKRTADPGGLDSFLQKIIEGASRKEILYRLRTSEEAANVFVDQLTRSFDNATFVEIAYLAFRKQKLTPKQRKQALNILESGQIRQTILRNFNQATETKKTELKPKQASNLPEQTKPSRAKLSTLKEITAELQHNFAQGDRAFLDKTQQLSDQDFIKKLYRTFFKREADPQELKSQVQQLNNQVSRWDILYLLRTSQEAAQVFLTITSALNNKSFLEIAYSTYFKRELDPEIKKSYLEYLDQGNPRQDILS